MVASSIAVLVSIIGLCSAREMPPDFDRSHTPEIKEKRMALCLSYTGWRVEGRPTQFKEAVMSLANKYPGKAKTSPDFLTHLVLQKWMMTCYMNLKADHEKEGVTYGQSSEPPEGQETEIFDETPTEERQTPRFASKEQKEFLTEIATTHGHNYVPVPPPKPIDENDSVIVCRFSCWIHGLIQDRKEKDENFKPGDGPLTKSNENKRQSYFWTEKGIVAINVTDEKGNNALEQFGNPKASDVVGAQAMAWLKTSGRLDEFIMGGVITAKEGTGKGGMKADTDLKEGWSGPYWHQKYERNYWMNHASGEQAWTKPEKPKEITPEEQARIDKARAEYRAKPTPAQARQAKQSKNNMKLVIVYSVMLGGFALGLYVLKTMMDKQKFDEEAKRASQEAKREAKKEGKSPKKTK